MGLLPAPNQNLTGISSPSNNYFAALPFQKSANTYDAKIDWQITEKDHLSGRYSYQSVTTFQAPVFGSKGGGPAQGGFQGTGKQNAYSTGGNYDHAFSSTLLTRGARWRGTLPQRCSTERLRIERCVRDWHPRRQHQPIHQRPGRHLPRRLQQQSIDRIFRVGAVDAR